MNSFFLKNSSFCFLLGVLNALVFFYLRLNLETPLILIFNVLLILFSSLFFPYFFFKNFFLKKKIIFNYLYPFLSIFLIFFIVTSLYFGNKIIIIYYLAALYCIYFLILEFFNTKKILNAKYLVSYLLILIFILAYYFVTISNANVISVFAPEQGLLNLLNPDTRFHAAISYNIQNSRQISFGLDGYAHLTYHYFYCLFIAAIGIVSNSEPLWTISAVQYIIFVPCIMYFVSYVAAIASNFKESFLYYISFSFFLLILSEIIFTHGYSYFTSATLPFSLFCVLSSVPTLLIFSNLKNNIFKFCLSIFLILFSILIFSNKVSSGSLYLLMISWIFFRNYKFTITTSVLAFLTVIIFYLNYFLFFPKVDDYPGYDGRLFDFFYILKVWGQISVFSPYLFVATYLLLIKFYFKLKSRPEIYFAEGLLIISIASLIFSLLGIPQDSAVLYFVYVPLIISIPMIVSKISLTDFKNLLKDKDKKIKNLKKIFAIFIVFIFLFISIDKAINISPQRDIIKKIVYMNNKLSNNKILNNNISEADYIRANLKKNYTIFNQDFQEKITLNFFSQIRQLSKTLETKVHIGFFVPPDNKLIWNFSEQKTLRYTLCKNTIHIVPSLVGYPTILGNHPLRYDCPKEGYTHNYLKDSNSRNLSDSNLCERAKRINLKTIYILKEENTKLKTKVIHCENYIN
jgi:hypothetical protein